MQIVEESPNQLKLEAKVVFGLLGSTTYTFDKSAGALKISGKGVFGSKPQEYPLAQFTGAVLQEASRSGVEMNDATARIYRIELVKQDGSRMPLTVAYSSGKQAKAQLVETIRRFLGTGA